MSTMNMLTKTWWSRARSSGPWSNASCVEGMAGGVYHCHLIDLLGFIALEDMGCGYTYD